VYVGDAGNGTVTVIEASDNSVASVIQVGAAVYGLAVSPDGTRVYAIDRGVRVNNAFGRGTVSVIDTATNAVIGKPITVGVAPEDIAVSPHGDRVYVVNADENTVSVIDSLSNTVEGEPIGVGSSPAAGALSPDGSLAYVTDTGDGTLSVIDTAAKTLVGAPIPVAPGGLLYGVAVSRDGTHIYATDFNSGTVSVVSHVPA
jgi:YVTN family beta-propeller protein